MNLDVIFHNMLSMTPLQRITMAKQSKVSIAEYAMRIGLDKKKADEFVIYYFRLFVAADAECDYRERDLFNRTFGMELSQRQFERLVGEAYDSAFVEKMAKITQKMPEDVQEDVMTLGLVILCSDNNLTSSEEKLLHKLVTPKEEKSILHVLKK